MTPGPGSYDPKTLDNGLTTVIPRAPEGKHARVCSLAARLSGEPFTALGEIDSKPKINPPLQYQWMFKEDELKSPPKPCKAR